MLDVSDPDAGKCLGGWVARPKLKPKQETTLMTRYTIMGEVVQPQYVRWLEAVSTYFPGFNETRTLGYWQGKPEESFKLEVLVPEDEQALSKQHTLKNLCERYRHMADQSEVWMTEDTVWVHKAVKPEPATV